MKLSIQNKKRQKVDLVKRKNLIVNEKLHIRDYIRYERFLELYNKYGDGLSEYDFAKYYLDISNTTFYAFKIGKIKRTLILNFEYVSSKKIEEIKKKVRKDVEDENIKKIGKLKLLELYAKYGEYLSLKDFAEETLGLNEHIVECLNSSNDLAYLIKDKEKIDRNSIRRLQNLISKKENLHIEDSITFSEIQDLYKKYGTDFNEKDFANKVLEISEGSYNHIKRQHKNEIENGAKDSTKKAIIFSRYIIDLKELERLREKVILKENLHIGDSINYKEFQRLYRKYAGIMSEVMFAEEILDITFVALNGMKKTNSNAMILKDIDLKEEYINWLTDKIVEENQLEQLQFLSRDEFDDLYNKYAGVLSRNKFAVLVLGVTYNAIENMETGRSNRIRILSDYETTDFSEMRRLIKRENNLHHKSKINYEEFLSIYEKYAPKNVKDTVFAEKALGIKLKSFYNIKYSKNRTKILLDEEFPSEGKIAYLKKMIIIENKLHYKDKMNYEQFENYYKKYYRKYGVTLTEEAFAEKIFDISYVKFKKIKNNSNEEIQILLKSQMTNEEIQELRRKIIEERFNSVENPRINLEEFEFLYNNYEHTLQQKDFAFYILGIDPQSLNLLKTKKRNFIQAYRVKSELLPDDILEIEKLLIEGRSEKEIAKKLGFLTSFLRKELDKNEDFSYEKIKKERIRNLYLQGKGLNEISEIIEENPKEIKEHYMQVKKEEKEKNKETLSQNKQKQTNENRFEKIKKLSADLLDEFNLNERTAKTIRKYIDECKFRIDNKTIAKDDLKLLRECIEFLDLKEKDIAIYCKGCIVLAEYMDAIKFINSSMSDSSITSEGKTKLKILKGNIIKAKKREEAINLIYTNNLTPKQIAERTGLMEVEVLEIMRRLKEKSPKVGEEK